MAILIGILESFFVLVILVSLTLLASGWYWRRRLTAVRQKYEIRHQTELGEMIDAFKHQAENLFWPIKKDAHLIKSVMTRGAVADVKEWDYVLKQSLADIEYYEWRLIRLIENMSLVSRLEASNLSLRFCEVKLDAIVSDVLKDLQGSAEAKGISMVWWARPERFPCITANDDGLRQVFINLIDNAIKYCEEKDEIDIALEANEGKKVIYARVCDTGPGIPEEDWERIFLKGYTVDGARGRKPKERSQGLGLYIAKLVVEKHRGTIGVTSELDKGTTFTITLPIQKI